MLDALLVGAVALLTAPAQQTDTTFPVSRDARIEIENFDGSVEVRAWDRTAVRVTAAHAARDRVEIRHTGPVVRIESSGRRGPPRGASYVVTVPAAAALRIAGPFSDVSVGGVRGDIVVETVRGDVRVRGGDGLIELRSVEGEVVLEGARGRVTLAAVNEAIRASDVAGDIFAETVNGDVTLERIASADVVASTVNGDIAYDGEVRDDGRYRLTTHNGDISIGIPEGANATVTVATYNGEIDSALAVTVAELRRGGPSSLTVGRGTARVELESFNGTIRLRRPAGR